MSRTAQMLVVTAMAAILVYAGVACDGSSAATGVAVTLSDSAVEPAVTETGPGKVRFEVSNTGTMAHELVVVKNDLPPEELAVVDGKVDESKVNVAGRTSAVAPGESAELSLELSPGKYVLFCNLVERPVGSEVVSHFESGQYASFLVEP